MEWFAAGLIVPMLAAYWLVACCDRAAGKGAATFFLRAGLAIGVGVGLSSCMYFLWLFSVGTPGRAYRGCELALFGAIGLLAAAWTRGLPAAPGDSLDVPTGAIRWHRFLVGAFVAALALAVIGAVGAYWKDPLGDWDAWAIWNRRARFLYRAGDQWRQAFSPVFDHVDYPLLLPVSNVRLWSYLGAEPVGALVSGQLVHFRRRWSSVGRGVPSAKWKPGVACRYGVVGHGAVLAARDLAVCRRAIGLLPPLGSSVMGPLRCRRTAVLGSPGSLGTDGGVCRLDQERRTAVVGRLAGGAMRCPVAAGPLRSIFKELLCWIAGVLPILAIVALQKACLAGSNDLVSGQNWEATLSRLLTPSRYWYVAQAFVLYSLRIARPFAVVLPLCFLFLGVARGRAGGDRGLPTACLVLSFLLVGYFFAYITTPSELHWHLASSAERLLLQLLPVCLLILFVRLATPQETWADPNCTP